MDDAQQELAAARRSMLSWGLAFLAGTFGVAGASLAFDLGSALSVALFVAAMLLLIPFVRSAEQRQRASGTASSAMSRYNRRMLVASFAYVVTLMGAIWLSIVGSYPAPIYAALAIAPSLPIIAMIWAMGRLIIEESDEYLRSRHIRHALVATGFILVLATVWGFLEQFNVMPHVTAYWVFPAWAIGLGISQCWSAVRS